MEQYPLISIITICRNARETIRRCLDSVVSLSYPRIEFVIQDGASTDGTLEILREYSARHDMIKLISAPDDCAADALFRVLKRCTGELIGSCLADEELLPFAAMWASQQFRNYPEADVIHADIYNTDLNGRILWPNHSGPFDLVGYCAHEMTPHFAGTFFRRSALEGIGLHTKQWRLDIGEFDIWVSLGLNNFKVIYIPEILTKYAVHAEELSERLDIIQELISGRGAFMDDLFARGIFPDHVAAQKNRVMHGYHNWASLNLKRHGNSQALYHYKMASYHRMLSARQAA